jgi:hypothetical protein
MVCRCGSRQSVFLDTTQTPANVSHLAVNFCFLVFQTNEGSLKDFCVDEWIGHESSIVAAERPR